jgi:hypothetical protein
MLLDVSNSGILYVQTRLGGGVTKVAFVMWIFHGAVISAALIQFYSCMFGLLHRSFERFFA